jgi:hypothetical protein
MAGVGGHYVLHPFYDWFYLLFEGELGINMRKDMLESDQGTTLKVICGRHSRHFFCLGHLLVSLSGDEVSFQVGHWAKGRSQKELDTL